MTTDVFAASDTPQCVSEDAWPRIAESYGFRWNLGSGCRLVGRLPETYTGQPVVDGPHQYVLKIVLTTDTRPDELLSNYIEAIIWEQAVEEGLSHLFAPVIAHGDDYRWIIMEGVVALDKDFWNEHGPVPYLDGWGKELKSQYREFKDALSEVPGKILEMPV